MSRKERISERIVKLVDRLQRLEQSRPEPHQRPIVDVGVQALRDELRRLGREMDAY